jgi:curved DNA-binding protein CbpA
VIDPYTLLGIETDAGDDAIKQAYLDQIRRYPPDHDARRFEQIRTAYERIRSRRERLGYRLFESEPPTPQSLLAHLADSAKPGRPTKEQFQALLRMSRYEIKKG